jgi:hypothetical protein
VADTAANEGQGAQRSGRLVSRVLFVLGGAVAGTAAAWLVSGAAASADTDTASPDTVEVGTSSVTPVTDATVGGLNDVDHGVSRFTGDVAGGVADATCHQEATTWSEPQRACGPTDAGTVQHDVSERVGGSVPDLTEDAVLGPVSRTLGSFEHLARQPEDARQVIKETIAPEPAKDFGRHVWQLLAPAAPGDLVPFPGHPGLAPGAQEPVPPGTGQATDPVAVSTAQLPAVPRASLATPSGFRYDDLTGAADQFRDAHRDLPSLPAPAQLPVAPSVPTAPGGTTAPGGHLDGLNFGVPFWTTEAVDSAVAAMNRAGLRHTPRTPGTQPGVTPD